jgi:hypothetical protein
VVACEEFGVGLVVGRYDGGSCEDRVGWSADYERILG